MAHNAKEVDSAYDSQRRRIEKLMENPEKLVEIPEREKISKETDEAPEFVRNVMGSSAGAGSGEFHVYRNLRRKELNRLKEMEAQATQEELDTLYKLELEEGKRIANEITAKKRAKRLKKKSVAKDKLKLKGKMMKAKRRKKNMIADQGKD